MYASIAANRANQLLRVFCCVSYAQLFASLNAMKNKYHEFIKFLFDRNESEGDWRFDSTLTEPELTEEEAVEFIHRMLEDCETELSRYSDWQLGLGIDYIFNNSCSDLSLILRDGSVAIEKRVSAIRALKSFFKTYLNKRCVRALGHLSEDGNELNHFCYMLWDTTSLTYCEKTTEKNDIYSIVAEVMEYSLSLDNIACIESGLHGLGHLELYYDEAPKIVRKFINSGKLMDDRLIAYAKQAEKGCVQ